MGKDGLPRGVTVSSDFVGQLALGSVAPEEMVHGVAGNRSFVFTPGTTVRFDLDPDKADVSGSRGRRVNAFAGPDQDGVAGESTSEHASRRVLLRYRMRGIGKLTLSLNCGADSVPLEIMGDEAGRPAPHSCRLSTPVRVNCSGNSLTLTVTDLSESGDLAVGEEPYVALDGILLVPDAPASGSVVTEGGSDELREEAEAWFREPFDPPRFHWDRCDGRPGVLLESNGAPGYRFYLESADERPVPPPPYSDATITHVYHRELAGTAVERKLSNDSLFNWYHVNCRIEGDGGNHFLGYNLGPFAVDPGECRVVDVAICADATTPEELRSRASAVLADAERAVADARRAYASFDDMDAESAYRTGVRTLRHYTVSNVTYPVRIGRELLRTYTPGRRWGGLFTWDSGMHGIGLSEYDVDRAASILDQYLPQTASDEVPVVLHGTPLPLHVYLLAEVARHRPDPDLVRRYYERALLYWSYFAGIHPDSTYDAGNIGMLASYSDGYNSIGIDDYPVQHYEGTEGLYGEVKTVGTTAHALRAAKILRDFGAWIGSDTDALTERIDYLTEGLLAHSWNPGTGWFEHVFTETREPLLAPGGGSFNMGFDGVAPLVAGICDEEQRRVLIDHLMSESEMWTRHGITAVSQSAPYFRRDGYWNGKVWIPHQWFIWKAMITEAEFDHAARIALTALEVFDRAARETYCSWELFDSLSGMGEGCHQFGGLSAPLAAFHNAYFRAGRFSPGFDTIVVDRDEGSEGWVDLVSPTAGRIRGIVRVPNGRRAHVAGAALPASEWVPDLYHVDRPGTECRVSWGPL
jgi:hypothetical protein